MENTIKDAVLSEINREFKELERRLEPDDLDEKISFLSAHTMTLNGKSNSIYRNSVTVNGLSVEAEKEIHKTVIKIAAATMMHACLIGQSLDEKEKNKS